MLWSQTIARQSRVRTFLDRLAPHPPNSLLLEGGTLEERRAISLFWAARLNCRQEHPPCGQCRVCVQIAEDTCRDLIFLDGASGTISIETIREIRSVLSDPPAGHGFRVMVLAEAQALSPAAANALLKSLEEPRPGNVFVLLAPSREILLPTLVSRSFVLTLGWPRTEHIDPQLSDWLQEITDFVQTGRGNFLDWTGKKGAVDSDLAGRILREVQRSLVQAGYGVPVSSLAKVFAGRLDVVSMRQVGVLIENALESLALGAQPAVTLEWAAMRTWGLMHK